MSYFDDEQALPCLETLIAGTLALMTAWAIPAPQDEAGRRAHRRLLARKIVSDLYFVQQHPQACPQLRQVVANVHRRWLALNHSGAASVLGQAAAEQGPLLH